MLEAYRECLRDVLDLPGLRELLGKLQRRELSLVEVETPTASPFASSLLFDYVATYMYEGDAPNAERRAAALSLDRDLLRELLGQEELRELLDPGALERLEEELQRRSEHTRAATRDELHDALRRVGDLTDPEAAERVHAGVDAGGAARRRSSASGAPCESDLAARSAGSTPPTPASTATRSAPSRPAGCPRPSSATSPVRSRGCCAAMPLRTVRSRPLGPPRATDSPPGAVEAALRELERAGEVVRGELASNAGAGEDGREWCDVEVLRRLRRASLAALRKEIEPAERHAYAAFLPAWHGIDRWAGGIRSDGAGVERLREQLVPLQGLALTPRTWEREVLPRRVGAYSPAWMDQLCAAASSSGSAPGRSGATTGA